MNIICIYHCVANGYKTYHSIYGGRKIQTKPACFDNLITENRVRHKKKPWLQQSLVPLSSYKRNLISSNRTQAKSSCHQLITNITSKIILAVQKVTMARSLTSFSLLLLYTPNKLWASRNIKSCTLEHTELLGQSICKQDGILQTRKQSCCTIQSCCTKLHNFWKFTTSCMCYQHVANSETDWKHYFLYVCATILEHSDTATWATIFSI